MSKFSLIRIKYFFANLKPRILGYKNLLISNNEISNLQKSNKKICLVYDLKTQPVSMGNYAQLIFFARYLSIKGYKIYIYIIKNKSLKQSKREIESKKYLFEFFNNLPKILIKKNLMQIKFFNWDQAVKNIEDNKLYVFFKKKTYERKLSPNNYVNSALINLSLGEEKKFFNKFLISDKTFKKFSNKKIKNFKKKKYVTILFRYDRYNPVRNTKKNEIIKIFRSINLKFPHLNIMIISDKQGCMKAKKFLKNKKNIFYSKDFSSSVYSDIYLQLRSDFCVASNNSGGMALWHHFSNRNFCFSNYMGLHVRLKYNYYYQTHKIFPWWNSKQRLRTSIHLKDLINLIDSYQN